MAEGRGQRAVDRLTGVGSVCSLSVGAGLNVATDVSAGLRTTFHAWVLLPNHYHFLAKTDDCLVVLAALGKLHGGTSFRWNGNEGRRGRQVWCRASETVMKSDRHFWASLNYVHHNPVKHGHAKKWQDWTFGSAAKYLETAALRVTAIRGGLLFPSALSKITHYIE